MEKKVTKEMGILDIAQQYPESIEIFAKYGLGCLGCAAARFENLEAGAKVHGFDPAEMARDINNDNEITVHDAVLILTYYAKAAIGMQPTWESLVNV